MPISLPTNPLIGATYDYGGIHYIYNGDGWVNKSIYGISAGTNISFSNYNGTGPLIISATDTTGITSAVTSFNGKTGAVQGVSSINGNTGAITNVAFTNAAQTFSGLQQFTQGISGSGGVTFYFSSGNTSIRFVSTAARYIEINPGSQNVVQGFGSGGFKLRANIGSLELKSPSAVIIGDTDLTNNGTQLYVDDDGGVISFVFSGGQFTFPNTDGSANYVMKTDGAGTLSWSPAAFTDTAQTFSALQSFSSGISASGGITFAGTVSSDTGYRISSSAINSQTGTTYTFLTADNGEVITFNNASAITVTIPTGLPVGFNCTAIQLGAGQVGFTGAAGVTLNSYGSLLKIAGQHGAATVISYSSNIYNIAGTLST